MKTSKLVRAGRPVSGATVSVIAVFEDRCPLRWDLNGVCVGEIEVVEAEGIRIR